MVQLGLILILRATHEASNRRGAHPIDSLSLLVVLETVVVLILLLIVDLLVEVDHLYRHFALAKTSFKHALRGVVFVNRHDMLLNLMLLLDVHLALVLRIKPILILFLLVKLMEKIIVIRNRDFRRHLWVEHRHLWLCKNRAWLKLLVHLRLLELLGSGLEYGRSTKVLWNHLRDSWRLDQNLLSNLALNLNQFHFLDWNCTLAVDPLVSEDVVVLQLHDFSDILYVDVGHKAETSWLIRTFVLQNDAVFQPAILLKICAKLLLFQIVR